MTPYRTAGPLLRLAPRTPRLRVLWAQLTRGTLSRLVRRRERHRRIRRLAAHINALLELDERGVPKSEPVWDARWAELEHALTGGLHPLDGKNEVRAWAALDWIFPPGRQTSSGGPQ